MRKPYAEASKRPSTSCTVMVCRQKRLQPSDEPFIVLRRFTFPFYLGMLACLVGLLGDNRLRGHGLMLGSGVIALITWQNALPSYVAIVAVGLIFICLYFFILGFGVFLAGLLRHVPAKHGLKPFAIVVSLILPLALSLWSSHQEDAKRRAQEQAERQAIAAFQKQVLTAQFGPHNVRLQVTPSLYIRHKCRENRSVCTTSGKSTGLNMASGDDLTLVSIEFSVEENNRQSSIAWCQNQLEPAVVDWCDAYPSYRYWLEAKEHVRIPLRDAYGATLFPKTAELDALACFKAYKGPRCIAIFDVADGIQARINTLGLSSQEAGARAASMRPHIEARWRTLKD